MKKIVVLLAAILVFAVGYTYLVSPWLMTRGATKEEVTMVLPGDELLAPNPKFNMTHAVTVNAPPSKIWPWLVQMGQNRAGFYSFEKLERFFGFDIHNTYRIVPEWQNDMKAGYFVKFHRNGIGMWVHSVQNGKAIVMLADSQKPMKPEPDKWEFFLPYPKGMVYNWSFNTIELPDGKTRLIIRSLASWNTTNVVLDGIISFFAECSCAIMDWQMINELKQLAEGTHPAQR